MLLNLPIKIKQVGALLFLFLNSIVLNGQYSEHSIFSHNDYAQQNPFYGAYQLKVGYIEADVFLKDNQLYVAHQQNEINPDRTLSDLYLKPIQEEIRKNKGWAQVDTTAQLKLMIDLKTEGISTLNELVNQIKTYPELLASKGFEIFVSGNVPPPDRWNEFPAYIHFDGRPGTKYTQDQLARITLISTSFSVYSKWDGTGKMPVTDKDKITELIKVVHDQGKKLRFWATPDFANGWQMLMDLGVDILGTDNPQDLAKYLKGKPD